MPELITRAEAYAHLRLDVDGSNGSPDDTWLDIFIPAVSDAVERWLKDPARLYVQATDEDGEYLYDSNLDPVPVYDSAGNPTVRYQVKAACLIELSSQYRFREGEGTNVVASHEGHGYSLSKGATALLSTIRRPTVS
jgi:hypothetical protein